MEEKPPCEDCELLKETANKPTECQECLPELMPENIEAWRIYSVISGQLIMGASGPMDINQNALHKAMELYEVENKRDCFERVCTLARHMLKLHWDKRKDKTT